MTGPDPDEQSQRLAAESLAVGDATGWFERLYVAADEGEAVVPWDRGAPHPLLVEWAAARGLEGRGRRAVVVGSGLGQDAEYVAGLGFATVAFDVAATAIRNARERLACRLIRVRVSNQTGAWLAVVQTVEPAIDFTATAALAFALDARAG